jgi:hypothetical protein
MTRRVVLSLFLLIALVLAFSGCVAPQFGGGSTYSTTDEEAVHEAGSGSVWSAPAPLAAPVSESAYYKTAENAGYDTADQMIIKTSSITLEVQDISSALDSLKSIAAGHGGYVGSMSVNTQSGDRLYAVLTMRVPASSFDSAIEDIKALGTIRTQSLQAEDVTEEYVDLQARRNALADQLDQYQRIMEKAENVSEILEVQEEIERVQVELDRIDGRLKYLDNRVDYATITVSLREPEPVGTGDSFSFTSVINEGIAGFLAVTAGIVIVVISLIPLIIIAVVAYLAYRWWKARKVK